MGGIRIGRDVKDHEHRIVIPHAEIDHPLEILAGGTLWHRLFWIAAAWLGTKADHR